MLYIIIIINAVYYKVKTHATGYISHTNINSGEMIYLRNLIATMSFKAITIYMNAECCHVIY